MRFEVLEIQSLVHITKHSLVSRNQSQIDLIKLLDSFSVDIFILVLSILKSSLAGMC